MRIRMVCGATRIGNKTVTSESGVFEVENPVGVHLISRGVAEAAEYVVATPAIEAKAVKASENPPEKETPEKEPETPATEADAIPYTERPEYSESMNATELRAIGQSVGIVFRARTSKKAMVEELNAFFDDYFDDAPDLTAIDPLV